MEQSYWKSTHQLGNSLVSVTMENVQSTLYQSLGKEALSFCFVFVCLFVLLLLLCFFFFFFCRFFTHWFSKMGSRELKYPRQLRG